MFPYRKKYVFKITLESNACLECIVNMGGLGLQHQTSVFTIPTNIQLLFDECLVVNGWITFTGAKSLRFRLISFNVLAHVTSRNSPIANCDGLL